MIGFDEFEKFEDQVQVNCPAVVQIGPLTNGASIDEAALAESNPKNEIVDTMKIVASTRIGGKRCLAMSLYTPESTWV